MSAFFSTISWFWLLLGVLLGWLLNRCLCKCCCKPKPSIIQPVPPPAKVAEMPAPVKTTVTTPSKSTATSPAAKAVLPKDLTKESVKETPKEKAKTSTSTMITIDMAAAKTAGFALKNASDLTVVEGIGPKINELFHNNGIKTLAQLASATVPQMRAILDTGGSRFRIANPSTWAKQAALAAENKWAELKKLQDALSGGVKK